MTLREEVLKGAGLLTEEILEEGKIGRAIAIGAMIAALAIGGVRGAHEIKDYKTKSAQTAISKYESTDKTASTVRLNFADSKKIKIKTDYSVKSKQAIINFTINVDDGVEQILKGYKERVDVVDDYRRLVREACYTYIEELKSKNSNIEKILRTDTYADVKPIYINVNAVWENPNNYFDKDNPKEDYATEANFIARRVAGSAAGIIANCFQIDDRLVSVYVNNKVDI